MLLHLLVMSSTSLVLKVFLVFSLTVTLSSCLTDATKGTESGTTVVTTPNPNAKFDPAQTVCDPFSTNSPQARDHGLIGNLLYLNDSQPRYNRVSDFMNFGVIAPQTIYLDRLFIPTRPFDRGFSTAAGELVTNANGNTLYEYFGLKMKAQIQLAANEAPGYYQFALLADDGAVMKIPDGAGGEKIIVNDDGTHPTQMACATEPVYLDRNSKIPVTVEYYQGPRYHISLVAMIRPWPDGVIDTNPVNDVMCGRAGNSLYFDSTKNPIEPQIAFYEMLSRNWKVLENENYFFPVQESNPCVPPEAPLAISSFSILGIARDRVTLTWVTNIPSTSQGQSKNVATSATVLTSTEASLVTTHVLTITGLLPNTLYAVKAFSSSAGGQNSVSDERAFRTPR